MAKRRRAVITAPCYAVDSVQRLAPARPSSFHPSHVAVQPCVQAPAPQPDALSLQGSLPQAGTGEGASTQEPGPPHQSVPAASTNPFALPSGQPPQKPTDQVLLIRRPWHVQYVAICPQELEPLARIFLADLGAAWHQLGCGSHLPAPACSYLRRVGGIAPVPPDWVTPNSSPGLTDRTTWGAAGLPGRFNDPETARSLTGGGPIVHPCLGVVSNYAAGLATSSSTTPGSTAAVQGTTTTITTTAAVSGPITVTTTATTTTTAAASGPITAHPPPPLQGLVTHRWSTNFRATLTALMTSLAAGTHLAGQTSWLAGMPPVLVVYLISPSDKPATAATCLVEAALQLAPLKHHPPTCTPAPARPPTLPLPPAPSPLPGATPLNLPASTPLPSSNNPSPSPLPATATASDVRGDTAGRAVKDVTSVDDMDVDTPEAGEICIASEPTKAAASAGQLQVSWLPTPPAAASPPASTAPAAVHNTSIVLQVLLPSLMRCTLPSTATQTALDVYAKVEASCGGNTPVIQADAA